MMKFMQQESRLATVFCQVLVSENFLLLLEFLVGCL
jgi:hypothetical protein